MRDLATTIGLILGMSLITIGLAFLAAESKAFFTCNRWHAVTDQETKVIAAKCFVHADNRWQALDTYVRRNKLDVHQE